MVNHLTLAAEIDRAGLYREAGPATKELLANLVASKQPIFAMPAWFVCAEAAQVAFMLSETFAEITGTSFGERHRTFFANSRYEAIHGAIKLMRHSGISSFSRHGGRVLVYDAEDDLRLSFDPLDEGPERALVPGVHFVRTHESLARALASERYCGVLLRGVRDPASCESAPLPALRPRRRDGLPLAVDLSDAAVWSWPSSADREGLAAVAPDLIVTGESLTDYEVPFGAFTGTSRMFAPWTSSDRAFLHSTTYGGNALALRKVAARLVARWSSARGDREALAAVSRAATDWEWVLELYERHVNPATSQLHRALKGLLHVVRAEGSKVTVELDSGRRLELVDGVCGGGLGVNGHNPDDARTEVLAGHSPNTDYVGRLRTLLARETGLARSFPAVSGATAVDGAVTLALLAQQSEPRRRRIVVFEHNYGGKTLVSLVTTAAERTRAPFAPLYDDVCYLDPFAPDATVRLEAELSTGRVALVWFELVHGSSSSFAPIPDSLLALVAAERDRRGFLIGVDEILTSYYRCGRRFAFHGRLPHVDIVTLSKALSYMCFPVAATVVSEDVYQRARCANSRVVDQLESLYANQLGAHFGLHSIGQVDALDLEARTGRLAELVEGGFGTIPTRSRSVGRRFAEGLFIRVEVLPAVLPRVLPRWLVELGEELFNLSVIIWWINRANVFILYDCAGVPLVASEADVRQMMDGVVELSRVSPYRVLLEGIGFLVRERLAAVRPLKRRSRKPEARRAVRNEDDMLGGASRTDAPIERSEARTCNPVTK